MTKQNFTSISLIIDRSGSMHGLTESTIAGINSFIEEQRKSNIGDCVVSLHQFDNHYQTDYLCVSINEIQDLTTATYQPRGATALHDAIGKTVNELGKRLDDMPEDERPDSVVVAIMTDGFENASREFSAQDIKTIIENQTNTYNWDFIFLAANQDAVMTGDSLGIKASNSMTYGASAQGVTTSLGSFSKNLSAKRGMKKAAYLRGASVSEAQQEYDNQDMFSQEDRDKSK
jgi:uncharacterized protein YegL